MVTGRKFAEFLPGCASSIAKSIGTTYQRMEIQGQDLLIPDSQTLHMMQHVYEKNAALQRARNQFSA